MDFPSDFDTRMFPGTRYLAMSRTFAILVSVLFLLIAGLAGMLIWTMRANRTEPILISIYNNGATWSAVLRGESDRLEYPAHRAVQEAAIGNFAKMWFSISGDADGNEFNWCRCDRKKCWGDGAWEHGCLVCCASGESLYEKFYGILNTDYRARAARGEEWRVAPDSIRAAPIGAVSERGGLWRLTASVEMTGGRAQNIEAFVRTARESEGYPATLGYYIADFHAYPADYAVVE